MEMMFEVCALDRQIHERLPFLIMYRNKGMNCHVLCRAVKKGAGLLCCFRSFTLVFYWWSKERKLYHTACEQKRALWVADVCFPLSPSFFLCLSVSVSHLSVCPLSLHSLALLHSFVTIHHIQVFFRSIINIHLCRKRKYSEPAVKWLIVDSVMLIDNMVSSSLSDCLCSCLLQMFNWHQLHFTSILQPKGSNYFTYTESTFLCCNILESLFKHATVHHDFLHTSFTWLLQYYPPVYSSSA